MIGLGLLIGGVAVGIGTVQFMISAERVDGKVVDMTARTSSDSSGTRSSTSTTWYPTVDFTVDGETHSFQGSVGSNPPAYEIGDPVEVAYDPEDPANARLASFWTAYFLPLVLCGIGVVFTPIGAVLLVAAHRTLATRAWLRGNGRGNVGGDRARGSGFQRTAEWAAPIRRARDVAG